MTTATVTVQPQRAGSVRRCLGGFYLFTAGVHLGIVAADTAFYRHFADGSPLPFVRDGWSSVFMAHPTYWGLALMAGEATLGVLLLAGGRAARIGWVGVLTFTVLLMLFGWGFWLWSVPVLVLLVPIVRADWLQLEGDRAAAVPTRTAPA